MSDILSDEDDTEKPTTSTKQSLVKKTPAREPPKSKSKSPGRNDGPLSDVRLYIVGVPANGTDVKPKDYSQIVTNLGGKVLQRYGSSLTHIVWVGGSQQDWAKAKKSPAQHIVSLDWLDQCIAHNKHVEEENYRVSSPDAPSKSKTAEVPSKPAPSVNDTAAKDTKILDSSESTDSLPRMSSDLISEGFGEIHFTGGDDFIDNLSDEELDKKPGTEELDKPAPPTKSSTSEPTVATSSTSVTGTSALKSDPAKKVEAEAPNSSKSTTDSKPKADTKPTDTKAKVDSKSTAESKPEKPETEDKPPKSDPKAKEESKHSKSKSKDDKSKEKHKKKSSKEEDAGEVKPKKGKLRSHKEKEITEDAAKSAAKSSTTSTTSTDSKAAKSSKKKSTSPKDDEKVAPEKRSPADATNAAAPENKKRRIAGSKKKKERDSTLTVSTPGFFCVLTFVAPEQKAQLTNMVESIDGELAPEVDEHTTHVICGEPPKRGFKVLMGIAQGSWILPMKWLAKSFGQGHLIKEAKYELVNIFPGCKKSREAHASADHKGLLHDLKIYVNEGTSAPVHQIEKLIEFAGGTAMDEVGDSAVVIQGPDSTAIEAPPSANVVNEAWLWESMSKYELLPFKNYKPPKPKPKPAAPEKDAPPSGSSSESNPTPKSASATTTSATTTATSSSSEKETPKAPKKNKKKSSKSSKSKSPKSKSTKSKSTKSKSSKSSS